MGRSHEALKFFFILNIALGGREIFPLHSWMSTADRPEKFWVFIDTRKIGWMPSGSKNKKNDILKRQKKSLEESGSLYSTWKKHTQARHMYTHLD